MDLLGKVIPHFLASIPNCIAIREPPYAERHVRWCERSENESRKKTFVFLLLDYPHSLSHNIYFHPYSLTFSQYLFFILTHFLTISIFHPISPFVNIKFFTLELALPIINPHFCTCAARSTATGTRRQDHGSWFRPTGFRPAGFRPAGPRQLLC